MEVSFGNSFGCLVWKFRLEILFGNFIWKFRLKILLGNFIWKFPLEILFGDPTDRQTERFLEAPSQSLKTFLRHTNVEYQLWFFKYSPIVLYLIPPHLDPFFAFLGPSELF